MKRVSRGDELPPCSECSLCLPQLWIGKTRSALPAMKVCLFSNPGLWTTGRHQKGPHRRCFKTSSDRRVAAEPTGLVTSRVPSRLPRHSEERGTPTGTCDFGQARIYGFAWLQSMKISRQVEKLCVADQRSTATQER